VRRHRSNPIKHARVSLSRANILLRDSHSCQYCGSSRDLTLDHIVPQSKGGGNTWENLVSRGDAAAAAAADVAAAAPAAASSLPEYRFVECPAPPPMV
jgi:hypothetical protein